MSLQNNNLDIGPNAGEDKLRRLFYYESILASGAVVPELDNLVNEDVEKVYWRLVNEGIIKLNVNTTSVEPALPARLSEATLDTRFNDKAPTASPTFTGTVSGVTKTHVGLGSVDNTSDSTKPVSAPQQAALDLLHAKTKVLHPNYGVKAPVLSNHTSILTDTINRLGGGDGVEFFTIIDVRGKIGSPLDNFYCYVAGHDSTQIWLVTSPSPTGPFTWRQSIMTTATSELFDGHISSPDVIWYNNKFHLYYHGPEVLDNTGQSTGVATSTDGITFTEQTPIAMPRRSTIDKTSYYATSTSYARVIDAGGRLVAVFQANCSNNNSQAGSAVTTCIGFATSTNGLTWSVSRIPLVVNNPGERGPFSPGISYVNGYWWLYAYNNERATVDLFMSRYLKPGAFRKAYSWFSPTAPFDQIDAPILVWLEGIPHLYYGVKDYGAVANSAVYHADVAWSIV